MRKFDPLKAYGTVTPPERGAVYYQDGGYFSAAGDLMFEDRPASPPKVITSEVTTVDSETGDVVTELVETEVDEAEAGDPKQILAAWLKGEHQLQFLSVRKLVKDAYGVVITTKDEIINYLVNTANLVPAELVRA